MPTKLSVSRLIALAAAITSGVALSRFTNGDWISGLVLTAAIGAALAWYLLTRRRPRNTRRY